MTPDTNGWSRAEMHVMAELKRLSGQVQSVDEKVTTLQVAVERKASIWGALSATVIALVAWAFRS